MSHPPSRKLRRAAFIDVNSFPLEGFTNGATIHYREILTRLQRIGLECAVLTVADFRQSVHGSPHRVGNLQRVGSVLSGIPVVEYLLDGQPEHELHRYRAMIHRALDEFRPDLLMVNTPPARLDEVDVALAEEVREYGAEVFCFVPDAQFPRPHQFDRDRYHRFRTALAGFRALCPSRFIAREVEAVLFEKVHLFYNLFSPESIVTQERTADFITFVNPHPMKGVRVFEEVTRLLPHRRFLVVEGWPYTPPYRAKLPNVEVYPFAEDMRRVWSRTCLLLVPSLCDEGYGRVVVEAQLNGIPVIAHRLGGLPEAGGGAAVLIDPPKVSGSSVFPRLDPVGLSRSAQAICSAIEGLLQSKTRYASLSRRARRVARRICHRAERRFWEAIAMFDTTSELIVGGGGTLVVAPHSDDAAFSVGGALFRSALRRPTALVTVFGRSNYTLQGGFEPGCREVTGRRKAEDASFAKRTGVTWHWLDLPEASLRLGSRFEQVFHGEGLCLDPPADLAPSLDRVIRGERPRCILAPAGLGMHIDHIVVRDIITGLARIHGVEVAYYEDLPYAASMSEKEIVEFVHGFDAALEPIYIPMGSRLDEKLEGIRLYRSQVGPAEERAIHHHATRWIGVGPMERIWSTVLPSRLVAAPGS